MAENIRIMHYVEMWDLSLNLLIPNPQLPLRFTSSAEQTENYFGYFMVNEETFVWRGSREENRTKLRTKSNFVHCFILEYQFLYLKRPQKSP